MYDLNRCFSLLEKLSFNRLAGTKDEEKAISILKEEIEKEGLVPQIEGFEIDAPYIEKASLKVLEPYQKEYIVTGVGMSGSTLEQGIDKELVYKIIVRKAHSFRGGMDSTFFYNLICMVLLISYIYYYIIYVWKIIIDTQTQPYL